MKKKITKLLSSWPDPSFKKTTKQLLVSRTPVKKNTKKLVVGHTPVTTIFLVLFRPFNAILNNKKNYKIAE